MTKRIRLMILETCPYSRRAFEMMDERGEEDPEYRDLDAEAVEEIREPELADSLDWYLPAFFADGKKALEGVPEEDGIGRVFREALKS